MSKVKTLEDLISTVRLRAGSNSDASSGTGMKDTDIASMINDEMDELITFVKESQQDYLTVITKITPVSNVSIYRVDPRALYQQIKKVYYVNSDGTSRIPLVYIDDSNIPSTCQVTEAPMYYLLRGNDIVFYPPMGSAPVGHYECLWNFKANTLVKSTECRQVTNVDTTTKTVTFATIVPASWTNLLKFDAHSKYSGAEVKQWDLAATTVSGTQIVFSSVIDNSVTGRKTIEIGDWVCLEQEAALPSIPTELQATLAQAAVVRLAEARGDQESVALHQGKLDRMLQVLQVGISHRTDTEKVVVNNDGLWDCLIG